jgi:hypothetical protein
MSDSAKGNVRVSRAAMHGSAPGQSAIEDEAEWFAAAFVPVWQFDDAGFSVGEELPDEDIEFDTDAVVDSDRMSTVADRDVPRGSGTFKIGSNQEAARASVKPRIPALSSALPHAAFSAPATDPFALIRDDAIRLEPSVVIVEDPLPEPAATGVAPTRAFDDTEVFRLPPRKGLLVGIAASVAIIVTALGITVIRVEAPEPSTMLAPTPRSTRVAEDTPIPPPASPSDMNAFAMSIVSVPSPTSPSARQATVAQRTKDPAHPVRNPVLPPKSSGKFGGGGIVRANPF